MALRKTVPHLKISVSFKSKMKKLICILIVTLICTQFIPTEVESFGNPHWFQAYLNYIVHKFQKSYYAKNLIKHLKGFRFSIQPIYDYGYGPWYEVGSSYFNNNYRPNYHHYKPPYTSHVKPYQPNYQQPYQEPYKQSYQQPQQPYKQPYYAQQPYQQPYKRPQQIEYKPQYQQSYVQQYHQQHQPYSQYEIEDNYKY
ncbi:hypothetical protein CHUAL_009930 [Chamberlinius hualienensis]